MNRALRPAVRTMGLAACLTVACSCTHPVETTEGPEAKGRAASETWLTHTVRSPSAPLPPLPDRARALLGTRRGQDEVIDRLAHSPALRFRPVGTSSVVYQMALDGPIDAAFKPRTQTHPNGYRAEVAAYRIARLLGMDNVPPATIHRVARDLIEARLQAAFQDAWPAIESEMIVAEDGYVDGAAIYWVPRMRDIGFDHEPRMQQWTARLRQGTEVIPAEETQRYADLSTLLAFDYLIGNWDRFSGANVQGTPDGSRLWVRDHNVAFSEPLSAPLHRRLRDHLHRCEQFSRRFVRSLAVLTETTLRHALRTSDAPASLLSETQLRGVLDRRSALLSYVSSLMEAHGERAVLSFP